MKMLAKYVPVGSVVKAPMPKGKITIKISDIEKEELVDGKITWWDEVSYPYYLDPESYIEVLKLGKI